MRFHSSSVTDVTEGRAISAPTVIMRMAVSALMAAGGHPAILFFFSGTTSTAYGFPVL
jgi:hypothetical protein